MRKFEIVSDSSCDLSEALIRQYEIDTVSFYVSFDDEHYYREGKEISADAFYQTMVDQPNVFPKTSMPTLADYMAAFEPLVEQGRPVLCICLNAAFSGSYQAAVNARTMVMEEYPEAEIRVIDSQLATVLQGALVQEAVRLRDEGVELEEAAQRLEAVRSTGRIFFTTNDLKYLAHGGRIGKAAAATGTILQMKPMIELYNAELNSAGIVRGRKKSLQRFQEMFREYVEKEQIDLNEYVIVTGYGYDYSEYEMINEQVAAMLADMGIAWEKPCDFHIGVTIGVHTGPHPIGMAIMRRA